MKNMLVVSVLVVAVLVIISLYFYKHTHMQQVIPQAKTFSELPGFTFQYPVYPDVPSRVQIFEPEKYAIIFFKDPSSIQGGEPIIPELVDVKKDTNIKIKISEHTPKNPAGIYYLQSLTAVTFITPEFVTTISNRDIDLDKVIGHGFSMKDFFAMVINTFK